MDPYYDDGVHRIYLGDCLEVMDEMDDRFDLVFTSPPYNLEMGLDDVPTEAMHDRRSVSRKGKAANRLTDGYVEHDDAMPQAEYLAWQHDCVRAMWGVLTDDGAIYYNHKPRIQARRLRLPIEFVPSGVTLRQVIIWDRVEKSQSYTEWAYVSSCEWILLMAKPGFRLPSRSHSAASDVWHVHPERGHREHPCPFPIELPATAIESAAPRRVLDPFCGSGTTLRAAADAGIPSVGIEKSERYCEMAARRLEARGLFDPRNDTPIPEPLF